MLVKGGTGVFPDVLPVYFLIQYNPVYFLPQIIYEWIIYSIWHIKNLYEEEAFVYKILLHMEAELCIYISVN